MSIPYCISSISNGQYHVRINLAEWLRADQIEELRVKYNEICRQDNDFRSITSIEGNILKYKSESLFPSLENISYKKRKVMIILGNPASPVSQMECSFFLIRMITVISFGVNWMKQD